MYLQRETNPHFYPQPPPELENQPPQTQHDRHPRFPLQPSQRRPQRHSPEILLQPPYTRPHHQLPKTHQNSEHHLSPPFQPSQPLPQQNSPDFLFQTPHTQAHHQPQKTHQNSDHHLSSPFQPPHHQSQSSRPQLGPKTHHARPANQPSSSQRITKSKKTKPITWMIAALCTLFWVAIILGGLIILIFYLLYRPHLPKFDVSSASLNAAYLDLGYLLNADINLLANFTNPNKKVNVDFSNMIIDLHTQGTLIATRYIEPFSVMRGDYKLMNVHMVSSQVAFLPQPREQLRRQIDSGQVELLVKGVFRTRSNLGFLRYSYWLYAHCRIVMSGPPSGVIVRKHCVTSR